MADSGSNPEAELELGIEAPEKVQIEADEIAERRLAAEHAAPLECEHLGNRSAEEQALARSAELMKGWEQTDDSIQRRYLLEGVGHELMRVHEAPTAPIMPERFEDERLLGVYDDSNFRIEMKEALFEDQQPRDALETYLHEYRHDEQAYELQKAQGVQAHEVSQDRLDALDEPYVSPEQNEEAYRAQFAERDAEQFGTEMANRILERRLEPEQGQEAARFHESDTDTASVADEIVEQRLAEADEETKMKGH